MCEEFLNDNEMSSFFSNRSHHCSHLNCHCSPHFGCPHYLPHGNLPQHSLLTLPNKSSSSSNQWSSANEVSMNMHEHEEFDGVGCA